MAAQAHVDDIAEGNIELEEADDETRDLVNEIFLDNDSDEEFLGFDADDLEFDEENLAQFQGDDWVQGNLDFRDFNFYGEKKINVNLGENPEMIDFVKLFIDDHVMDIMV